MPVKKADTLADFAAAESLNTRVRYDEQIELASRNLLSNPDLKDTTSDTNSKSLAPDDVKPENVTLGAASEPTGWGVYIRKLGASENGGTPSTRQNLAPLDMARDLYVQNGPLVLGSEPTDQTRRARIASPGRPEVEVDVRERAGLTGGFRAVAVCWIVGPNPGESKRITGAGPRTVVEIVDGEGLGIILPDAAPEGVTGIAVVASDACETENEAMRATLWIQRRIPIGRGIPATWDLTSFLRLERVKDNSTYVGNTQDHGPPEKKFVRASTNLPAMETRISYSFLTEFGWSESQGTQYIQIGPRPGQVLAWRPRRLPPGTIAWRPEFIGSDYEWYALPAIPPNAFAVLPTNETSQESSGEGEGNTDPRYRLKAEQIERSTSITGAGASGGMEGGDATGIEDPDAALEEPTIVLSPAPPAGIYEVRTTLYDDEGRETPSSPPVTVSLALGQTIVVHRPPAGNFIANANRVSYNPLDGKPEGWTFAGATPNLVITQDRRAVTVKDTSGVTVDEDIAVAPRARIRDVIEPPDYGRFAVRFVLDFTRYFTGAVRCDVRFFDVNGANIGPPAVIGTVGAAGGHVLKATFSRTAGEADHTVPVGAKYIRLVARAVGSSAKGQRNFDVDIMGFGAVEGLAIPPRVGANRSAMDDVEEEDYEYPVGGRCFLLRNPKNLHADLAGTQEDIHAVRYTAPVGTPKYRDHFVTGYRTPVRAGITYTLSCYAGYEGVTMPTEYFVTAFMDAFGRTIKVNPPLVPNVSGSRAERRWILPAIIAPPGSSTLEIISGGGSDGHARAYAFQLEESDVASPYTNRNALSGWKRITLDSGLPGIPGTPRSGGTKLSHLGNVERWIRASAVHTDAENEAGETATSVDISMRSTDDDPLGDTAPVWSAWTADFESVASLGRRWWQIEVSLFSTVNTFSPLVDWVGMEFTRERSMLLRADGTEYFGGIQADNVTPIHGSRIREQFISDSNERMDRRRGVRRRRISFDAEGYLPAGVEAFLEGLDEGSLTNVIEDTEEGYRYTVMIDPDSVEFTPGEGRWEFDKPHHRLLNADGIEAEVIARERL